MSAICNVLIIRKSSDESEQVIQAVFRRMPFNETRNDESSALIIGFKGLPGFTVSSLIMELNGSPVGS